MQGRLHDFDIKNKVLACVTDNTGSAYNISEYLEADAAPSPFFKVRCAAHLLQLAAIKNGMKDADIRAILDPVRAFCVKVRRSTPLSQKLEDMCRRTGEPYHRPQRDMDVRWNSTYALVRGLLPMETAIMRLFRDDSDFKDVSFDGSVWSQLRAMVKVLQPFAKATVFMQGLTFPTLGVVAQAVDFLVKQMAEFETDLSIGDEGNKLALHIGSSLSGYLPVLLNRSATQLSAALHPSVKLSLAEQANGAAALRGDLIAYLRHNSPDVSDPPASPAAQAQRSRTPDFLDLIYKRQGLLSAEGMSPEQQLSHYLAQEPTTSRESPLIFWSTQSKLPDLVRMARDLLAIPATTAASESSFSRDKLLLSDRRNLLSSTTVSKMMCLDSWISAFGDNL